MCGRRWHGCSFSSSVWYSLSASFLCLQVLKNMLYSTRELGASWNLIEKITCEEGFVASRTGQSVARVRLHVGQPCHLQGAEQILRLQGLIQNKLDSHTL